MSRPGEDAGAARLGTHTAQLGAYGVPLDRPFADRRAPRTVVTAVAASSSKQLAPRGNGAAFSSCPRLHPPRDHATASYGRLDYY